MKEDQTNEVPREDNQHEQLKIEINHILDSGANDVRLIELFEHHYQKGAYWFDKFTASRIELQSLRDQLAAKEKECEELNEIIGVLPKEEIRMLNLDLQQRDETIKELKDTIKHLRRLQNQ